MLTIKLIFHNQVRQKRDFFFKNGIKHMRNKRKNSEFVFNFFIPSKYKKMTLENTYNT